tara:strand:+ start:926 stop:1294 length:369 start_codon:yes stop_codon:yes gene_type:complete
MCDDVDTPTDDFLTEQCRLNLTIKEDWSAGANNANVRFLVNAENIGDLAVNSIHVTVYLYFKNDDILKTRFYINDLDIQPGESIEEFGIIFESDSERFFTDGLSQNDLDRIIYNAPYYTCLQ